MTWEFVQELESIMPKKTTTAQQRARATARAGGKYTAALRAEAEAAAGTSADDPFGGHEFEYEGNTDLFRCSECGVYEVTARKDGVITPCPGLTGYAGDTRRVYLLLRQHPQLRDWQGTALVTKIRRTGLGRSPRFSYRDGWTLIESAPSVVDELVRQIEQMTFTADSIPGLSSRQLPAAVAITHLTAEAGQVIIAENYLAYVAEYGEPDGRVPRVQAGIRTADGVEFTPHPGARPALTCGACARDRIVLVAVESVGALQWVYACPACGTQTTAARRDPHDRPPFSYVDVMPWTIDRRPTGTDSPRTAVTAAYLADLGQPVDVLAALPIHAAGSLTSRPLDRDHDG
jgi:hypothetical protein